MHLQVVLVWRNEQSKCILFASPCPRNKVRRQSATFLPRLFISFLELHPHVKTPPHNETGRPTPPSFAADAVSNRWCDRKGRKRGWWPAWLNAEQIFITLDV
jgi:hypothetical protein